MNCTTPRVDFGNEVFHTNESIKLEEIATATSSRYSRDSSDYPAIIFGLKAGGEKRWIYTDDAIRNTDFKNALIAIDTHVLRSVVTNRSNANTTPFLLVAANPMRKSVVIKNTTNVPMQIKYENSSTPTISATSYTRVILTSTITTGNEVEVYFTGAISARFNTTPNANPIFTTETF